MKLHKYAVVLLLIVETQCGIIDHIYGTVKNTTIGLKQDVKNVWTSSARFVGIKKVDPNPDNRSEEEKRGLLGGIVHSAREKAHSVKNYFWNTDDNTQDSGVFGNMFNRVKNRLLKVKGLILAEGDNQINGTGKPTSEQERLIGKTLNKLFFGNGTRQVHGHAFQEAVNKLRNKLHEIRNNMTATTAKPVLDGEGLIDIRIGAGNIRDSINENTAGVANDIYDKVDDSLNRIGDKSANTYNDIKQNVGTGVDGFRNGIDSAANQLNGLKDKVSDATARENELLANGFNSFSANVQSVGDSVKSKVEDAKRLSY